MKFSHSIQFNAVPEWSSHYISYSNLKKAIYQLEQQINRSGHANTTDPEHSPLLTHDSIEDPDKLFIRKLDDELDKICSFYRLKELEILGEVEDTLQEVAEYEAEYNDGEEDEAGGDMQRQRSWNKARRESRIRSFFNPDKRKRPSTLGSGKAGPAREEEEDDDESDEEDNEQGPLTRSTSSFGRRGSLRMREQSSDERAPLTESQRNLKSSAMFSDYADETFQALYDEGITLKKRLVGLYVNICELRSFIQLNETGFSKVLKKYDKILDRKLKSAYVQEKVKPAQPFQPSTFAALDEHLRRVEQAYASIVTKGDVDTARQELRLHLREHVVWERNTVWREMIGIERKAQAANLGLRNTMLGRDTDPKKARLQGDAEEGTSRVVSLPIGKYRLPKFLLSSSFWMLSAIIAVFVTLLIVPTMERPEQQNCLALVVFVSLLWATEVCAHKSTEINKRTITTDLWM
jgi:phosphate transporter